MNGQKFESTTHDLNDPSSPSPPSFTAGIEATATLFNNTHQWKCIITSLIVGSKSVFNTKVIIIVFIRCTALLVEKWHFPTAAISIYTTMAMELLSLGHKHNASTLTNVNCTLSSWVSFPLSLSKTTSFPKMMSPSFIGLGNLCSSTSMKHSHGQHQSFMQVEVGVSI